MFTRSSIFRGTGLESRASGEDELKALAMNGFRMISGETVPAIYS